MSYSLDLLVHSSQLARRFGDRVELVDAVLLTFTLLFKYYIDPSALSPGRKSKELKLLAFPVLVL